MPRVWNRRFAPLSLLAAAAAMALGACGSDGSDRRKASTADDAPPAQRADDPERLRAGPQCAEGERTIVAAPAEGLYHAAMPSLLHDDLTAERSAARVRAFERLADRRLAWVYFSDNWFEGIAFPGDAVEAVRATGSVPFIRIMPRSSWEDGRTDPKYG